MTGQEIHDHLLSMPHARLDYPFGEGTAVYKVGHGSGQEPDKDKMFAIMDEGANPVRLSLKCDPELALVLREKYETVLPGYHLNKKHWNTIICSGQISDAELHDLIRHSFELVKD